MDYTKIWKNKKEYLITNDPNLIKIAQQEGKRVQHVGSLDEQMKQRILSKGIEIIEAKKKGGKKK